MACKKTFAVVVLIAGLLFCSIPNVIASTSCDLPDEDFGGLENDASGNEYYIELGSFDVVGKYTQNVNLTVDAHYFVTQDDVMPLGSVGSNYATVVIKSVPAGATVSGTINVFFTGSTNSLTTEPGFVYNYVYKPPATPTVSLTSIYFSSDFSLTCRTTAYSNGMLIFDNTNSAYASAGQGGSIPVLNSSFQVHTAQQVSISYSITNTSTASRDASISIQGASQGVMTMIKSASLASLFSASGVDYSTVLSQISSRTYSLVQGQEMMYNLIKSGFGTGNESIRAYIIDISSRLYTNNTQNQAIYDNISRIFQALQGSGGVSEIIKNQTDKQIEVAENQLKTEQEQLATEKEQLETSKGIFGKITDFFDNFFTRLQEFVVHLIIPTQEEITAFFDEVNEWFSARLGFIWYPFDLMLQLVDIFASGSADQQFAVPAFSINILGTDYQIFNGLSVDLDAFGIFKYVRIITSFLMISGIVKMAMAKWDEWIGGHGT